MHSKCLVAVLTAVIALGVSSTAWATTVPAAVPGSAVAAAVAQAPAITKIPSDLRPSLVNASNDQAPAGNEGCVAGDVTTSIKNCVYGDKKSSKVVVLVGDSHAGMWNTSVDLAARRAGWKLVLFSKTACPAVNLSVWDTTTDAPYKTCDTWNHWVLGKLRSMHPEMVILTSDYYAVRDASDQPVTTAQWATGLTSMIRQVKRDTKSVVVIGDIPYLAQSDPECLAANESAPQHCNTPASTAVNGTHDASEMAIAQANGADYINVVPWLCSSICTAIIGNMVVYHNQYHLSATYTRFISGVLGSVLPFGRTQ